MKICAISDLHGYLPTIENDHEVTIICGDISPLNIQSNNRKMRKWLLNEFKPWCESLPSKKVYFIAGNHDIMLFRDPEFMYTHFPKSEKVVYLNGSSDIYNSLDKKEYRIYGTPWCHQFGNWAFMTNDEELAKLYLSIPNNLDILMTHDQPYGFGDILLQETVWNNHKHIGNVPLLEAILIKRPKYMFCGHLHSTDHNRIDIIRTKRYNVSIKDEFYENVYEPLYLDI